eukprot:CAMPEP_0185770036 /NCGR_PEP_ID=MMETSP1174-20130828/57230_1 /TAXON_ID=35687 /ORGANISM="Dictyocha speculum, Strain CCMP1381" /LENGTH=117 /DNA_ID=CAMNT_0028455325 /DNA_START=598 /DNA_END=952 /DNA_ORIENTATION=+
MTISSNLGNLTDNLSTISCEGLFEIAQHLDSVVLVLDVILLDRGAGDAVLVARELVLFSTVDASAVTEAEGGDYGDDGEDHEMDVAKKGAAGSVSEDAATSEIAATSVPFSEDAAPE